VRINRTQSAHAELVPKLMQHFGIWHSLTMGQKSKATPRPIFFQQFNQQIKGVSRSQECQQMNPEQLSWPIEWTWSRWPLPTTKFIDKIVWDKGRELLQ
jgi:hypothetical protein